MQELNAIWEGIKPYMPIIIQVVLTPIFIAIVKAIVGHKVDDAMNEKKIKKMYKEAFEEVVAHIQKMTFNQDIQPLVESALVGVQEKSMRMIKGELDKNVDIQKQSTIFLKAFMDMFNNSVMSSATKQAELQEDFDKLMKLLGNDIPKEVESVVVVEKKKENNELTMEM